MNEMLGADVAELSRTGPVQGPSGHRGLLNRQKGGAHAAAPGERANRSERGKRTGFYTSELESEAIRQGMTGEEHGLYKGSVGSFVKPGNSAGDLLGISLLLTAIKGALWV